jgi:hypothetical protein
MSPEFFKHDVDFDEWPMTSCRALLPPLTHHPMISRSGCTLLLYSVREGTE